MYDLRIEFHVERCDDSEGNPGWRATLADDYTTWGYGDTPYGAIRALLEDFEWQDNEERR